MIAGRRLTFALGVALLVSLGTNFFLGGLLLSRPEPRGGFGEKLSDTDRKVVRGEFEARREQIEPHRTRLQAASQAVRSALTTTPFDPAVLDAAFAELRRANSEYRAVTHQALVAAAAQVSPDARARMAEAPFLRRAERDRKRRD